MLPSERYSRIDPHSSLSILYYRRKGKEIEVGCVLNGDGGWKNGENWRAAHTRTTDAFINIRNWRSQSSLAERNADLGHNRRIRLEKAHDASRWHFVTVSFEYKI